MNRHIQVGESRPDTSAFEHPRAANLPATLARNCSIRTVMFSEARSAVLSDHELETRPGEYPGCGLANELC
jgi:hypothetical protein